MDLVVVSGWTGAGKSTLADALAAELSATVASFDWLMSSLRSFPEIWAIVEEPAEHQREVGWSLLSRVAEQQLRRGASVVLDLMARDVIVAEWAALASRYSAKFSVLECYCTDPVVHRSRVEGRNRDIPDWYELSWERVERGRNLYPPLTADKLVVDSINPLANNVAEALGYVRR